jgi:hypothetical protein
VNKCVCVCVCARARAQARAAAERGKEVHIALRHTYMYVCISSLEMCMQLCVDVCNDMHVYVRASYDAGMHANTCKYTQRSMHACKVNAIRDNSTHFSGTTGTGLAADVTHAPRSPKVKGEALLTYMCRREEEMHVR